MTATSIPGKPPVPIKYLLWDGTDPVDSYALGNGLEQRFRCENLLNYSPATEEFCSTASKNKPRVFQPSGPTGATSGAPLFFRSRGEFPNEFFNPTHHNSLSQGPDILAYSGHGVPGFMFSESANLIATSKPITDTPTSWTFTTNPTFQSPKTRLVIFSACRQLAGRPQQFLWASAMRGAGPVHCILSYRNTAPAANDSAAINKTFVANSASGQSFVNAWKNAHTSGDLPRRWAALCYRSAVNDSLLDWAQTGSLKSTPATSEDILYFDNQNPSGRVVTQPTRVLDMNISTHTGSGDAVAPPWSLITPRDKLTLTIKWTDASNNFMDGDTVWITAFQVRPDYFGPFNIYRLFVIEGDDTGQILPSSYCHDASRGWKPGDYTDTYEFDIDRKNMKWCSPDATWNSLAMQITIGSEQNDHLQMYYLMMRIQRGSQQFGIPATIARKGAQPVISQTQLVDDFQFCQFILHQF